MKNYAQSRLTHFASLFGIIMSTTFSLSTAQAASFNIVENGNATAVIVLPESPAPALTFAAEELQHHAQLISGAQIKVLSEASAKNDTTQRQIHLGKTAAAVNAGLYTDKLPANAYKLAASGDRMFIAGNDTTGDALNSMTGAGTAFGIYDLLEAQYGVRWLWPGDLGTVVQTSPSISFNVDTDKERIHSTAKNFSLWRAPYASGSPEAGLKNWQSREAGERYYVEQAKWLRRHRFGIGTEHRLVDSDTRVFHSFLNYWEKYGKDHPEYFNLLADGTRREHPGRKRGGPGTTLCVSNPALHKQIVDDWRNSWRGRANEHLLLGENDSPALCTCDICRSWDAPDPRFETSDYWGKKKMFENLSPFSIPSVTGNSVKWGWHGELGNDIAPSLSDRYAKFYLAVQREAEKTHPNAVVAGFAYLNYWQAPKNPIQLNDRVIISFVPPTRVPYTEALSQEIRRNYDGWRKTGAQIYLRPNFPTSHTAPMAFAKRFARDLKYFADNGLIGSDYDSLNRGHFGTQGTSLYAVARSNMHPGLSASEIINEYYSGFGAAAPSVKRYFDFWETVSEKEVDAEPQEDLIGVVGDDEAQANPRPDIPAWVKLYHYTFTPEIIAEGRRLMNDIKNQKVASEIERQRIQYLDDAFHEVELTVRAIDTFVKYNQTGEKNVVLKSTFGKQYQELLQHRATLEGRFVGDYSTRQNAENIAFRSIRE